MTKHDVEELNGIIRIRDREIGELKGKLSELEIKASVFGDKESLYKDKILYMEELIASLKLSSDSPTKELNPQSKMKLDELTLKISGLQDDLKGKLTERDEMIKALRKRISELNTKINELDKKKKLKNIYITTPYGATKQLMYVPGFPPFRPTLEHGIAGPGWVVIQRRINGLTNFQTNLVSYRNGFGDPKGELWLGLVKLHAITSYQRHELYVHIVDYDHNTHYARYDNFVVGNEKENYELKSLGTYVGDASDAMRLSEKKPFTVPTSKFKSGWWWYDNIIPTW